MIRLKEKLWAVIGLNLRKHWVGIVVVAVFTVSFGAVLWPQGPERRIGLERVQHHATPVAAKPAAVVQIAPPSLVEPQAPAQTASPVWAEPLNGPVLLPFGWVYSPTYADWRYHPGVDLGAPVGTPIRAARGGQVAQVTQNQTWGDEVVIVSQGGWQAVYAEMGSSAVWPGQHVVMGQVIGTVGAAVGSEVAEKPHLHFELDRAGVPVNPVAYLPAP